MTGGINFNPNNQARFVNNNIQAEKAAVQPGVLQNMQQAAVKNANEFITQSARSLYQFFANAQSAQMKGAEMSLVLKDLLSMQKDIEAFLTNITNNRAAELMTKADVAKLLMNSQLDLSQLKTFMQQNGKESLAKLFNMTANFAQSGAVARSSQMSEIIAILNACTPGADTSQVQVLKNMMLLYLPWLPLGEQNFKLDIGHSAGGEEDGQDGEDTVTVLISTIHFGNVHVLIFKTDKSAIGFNISASPDFPKDKVIEQLQLEAKDYNIQAEVNFEKKQSLENKKTTGETKTQVSVNTSKHINPFLILMAQTAVRIIIELDKNAAVIDSRKAKL